MVKKKILIIDDEQITIDLIKTILKYYKNVEIIEAVDGHKGFELAKLEKPDLILLDNRMPLMSGEQAARLLRTTPSTNPIPIIMITVMRLSQDEIRLIKMDVNEYIQKPFNSWELKRLIEKYIGPLIEDQIQL